VNEFRKLIWAAAGYTPTAAQAVFHADNSRLKLVAGGIRGGKSNSTAREFDAELATQGALLWIVGPDYEQCKPEFDYLFAPLHKLGFIEKHSTPEKGSRTFTLANGARVQTKSSDDTTTLASYAPNAILMVEAGQQTYETYQKVVERALEHNAKVIMSGTFEGALSWYADLFERWQGPNPEGGKSFSIPSWSNTYKFPGGRTDPKIVALETAINDDALFMERCGAVPYKPSGLVFKKFDRSIHVARCDFNPDWPIEIAIDPAKHTYAVEAVQWFGPKVRVIDEIYLHGTIAQDVIPIVMDRPWWKHVKQNAGTIDNAGKQQQGNKSQVQIWQEMAGVTLRSHYVFQPDGIDVLKLRLQERDEDDCPLLQFDFRLNSTKAHDGRANGVIAEMGLFKWKDWKEGHNQTAQPVDANNDGCKALWYWLYDRYGPVKERRSTGAKRVQRAYWG
jgi:hypothetical protein